MSEGVPAPRKRTQPTKPRAPKKTKVVSQTKVEEAPPIINEETTVWEKELDDLFRTLRDPQDKNVSEKDPACPLHTHVKEKSVETRMGVRPMQREELSDLVTVGSSFELRVIRSPA